MQIIIVVLEFDYKIDQLDNNTCNCNKIYFWRLIKDNFILILNGWISQAELVGFMKFDSIYTIDDIIDSKLDLSESLSRYVNGIDSFQRINDLSFTTHILKPTLEHCLSCCRAPTTTGEMSKIGCVRLFMEREWWIDQVIMKNCILLQVIFSDDCKYMT